MKIIGIACMALLISFNACKSDQKDITETTKPAADSVKNENKTDLGIGVFTPPDSAYSGDYFEKYPTGVIKVRGSFRFGKKNGKWMYFFPDGKLWSEAFFNNDKMNGESNVFHPNGQLMYSGHYKMDMADSVWMFYDSLGKLVETRDYNQPKKKK
jgi:antitoxin component YwqK of YwqJK toxin-antitoxin module